MAVRIVDPEPHKSVVKEIVCGNCGVTLSYVPHDEDSYQQSYYDGSTDTKYFIPCPKCATRVVTRSS